MTTSTQLEIVADSKPVTESPPPAVIGQLRKLITDAENQAEKAVGAYFKLCVFIREKQISPEQLTKELTQRKYAKQRITEIKTVSYAPELVFKRYQEKVTSFRLALGEARQEKRDKQHELAGMPGRAGSLEQLKHDLDKLLAEHLPLVGRTAPYAGVTLVLRANNWPVTVRIQKRKNPTSETASSK